ncbi:acetyl-CoA carboxylase carboxyltransferase subunit alpha/beta [Actinomadura rupiterrae]|uniref:acetyl-CoA carboxylase carboxyltransferase subunit alpha/beta n=1 Tax=Actinomadura rupiterrae TaxID=559627 RepID=UPI0020A2BF74|nr:acetyl-CoA carboxylase carboxyltransferase subunit alpha/beta [Actinomadura rupiterrae]MCP2341873.1 acetyl-CoA carboxylase carboxyl transferase subunit beta [Actinomadura rupiterrae]
MNAPLERPDAAGLLDRVLDPGSFEPWDVPPTYAALTPQYAADLARAHERSGRDEAVVTGAGLLRGRRVAVVVSEFAFLAGSIGIATADRIVSAVERATSEGLPLLAAPSSGGTRMQEGTIAFVQMARITAAVMTHRAAGLPYLVYLRHPTTGGVLASWGSLGHVTAAEPGALIGFLGPRVYETLNGKPFPPGVQTAENLAAKGLLDAVVGVDDLPATAAQALETLCAVRPPHPAPQQPPTPRASQDNDDDAVGGGVSAWESVERSRRADRPGIRELLRFGASGITPLSGTGDGDADPGLLLALARFGDASCVVIGQDRAAQRVGRPIGPAGLRVARRGMRLAAEFGLPLVTVVDTPGAELSPEAEERGLAGEIARCLADLITLRTPTLCLLLGEGSGGAALALLPADRVLAARHAWLAPLPPEGASAIVHRTPDRAPELAAAQRVRAEDLRADGIVDEIVPERPDAADEPEAFCERVAAVLARELPALRSSPQSRSHRYARR